MPFTVFKNKQGWKIRKPSENKVYPQVFKTKESAIKMASNWMKYRHEKPNVKVEGGSTKKGRDSYRDILNSAFGEIWKNPLGRYIR